MWSITITLLIVVVCLLWGYSRWRYSYWSARGVEGPTPIPYLGNTMQLYLGESWNYIEKNYNKYKHQRIFGIYEGLQPSIMICDPHLASHILIKDFDHFVDRRTINIKGEHKWINEMLTAVNGTEWKALRSSMSPAFSSGKMKMMYYIVHDNAKKLVTHCIERSKSNAAINMKDTYNRYSMDVIASVAFGIESNSLEQDKPIFTQKAEKLFTMDLKNLFLAIAFFAIPQKLIDFFKINLVHDNFKFFADVSKETISQRRKSGLKRGDFLDLLLEEQSKQSEDPNKENQYKITDDTILAQATLFLLAGYENTANTMTFTTHYLAKHTECQDKLRQELRELLNDDGSFDYHAIMEAKYLDACISESLRLMGPAPVLERVCIKDYVLPEMNIKITEGMYVEIPSWGIHRDPEYWPEPTVYKPERFMPENKPNQIPFTYIPFGAGPRNCIAMRFSLMEAKIAIAEVIMKFKINLASGHENLDLVNGGGTIRPGVKGVNMHFEEI